jgi:hypothetical protein
MSSAITIEGQTRINQLAGNEKPMIIDRMVLALIPDLDYTQPVERNQQIPDPAHIVHTQAIDPKDKGYVNPDQVVYSIILDSDVGDFSFNWIGTVEKDTDKVITVTTTPVTPKRKTNLATNTTGNCITRNVLMAFQNAQALTGITISAETWQFNYESKFNCHAEKLVDPTKVGTEKAHMTNNQAKAWNDKIEAHESRFNALKDSSYLVKLFEPHKVQLELFAPGYTLYSETTWTVDQTTGQAVALDGGNYQATGLTVGNLSQDKTAVVRRTDNDAILAAFFKDAAHTDWTPAPWAWRRDAGNGFVDVEYQIPARGAFDFKIDSTAGPGIEAPTVEHIVFVECETGQGGTHNPPIAPSIVSPANGATNVDKQPSLTTNAYDHPVGTSQAGSRFQISITANFETKNIIDDSGIVPGISYSPADGKLATSTTYYIRARHIDATGGQSPWSDLIHFTTASSFITVNKPSGINPAAGEELSTPDGLTLVSSDFATEGGSDAHAASQWQVASDPAFTSIVYDSNETESNKTSYNVPDGIVKRGKTYYWRVRHKGAAEGWSDWSNGTLFSVISIANGVRVDGGIAVGPYTFADGQDGYLIVAPASQRKARTKWGLSDNEVTELLNLASAGATDPHTGKYNTGILTSASYNTYNDSQGSIGSPAANFCANLTFEGQSDFFLPNKEELAAIIAAKDTIDITDDTTGTKFSAMGTGRIWSSSKYNSSIAWNQRPSDGNQDYDSKYGVYWVVPCRRFIL